jgi:hypothetical protein
MCMYTCMYSINVTMYVTALQILLKSKYIVILRTLSLLIYLDYKVLVIINSLKLVRDSRYANIIKRQFKQYIA